MMGLSRRSFVAGCATALLLSDRAAPSHAGQPRRHHVPWLEEAQTPPPALPDDAPQLKRLLADARSWSAERERLVQTWKRFLGDVAAPPRPPIGWTVLEEERLAGIIRRRVLYEGEPGDPIEAYLLLPRSATGKLPGVVVHHSTVDYSIRQPAGLEGPPEKHFGLKLAQRGYAALCPRNFLWPENGRIDAQRRASDFLSRRPGAKGMAKMLFHSQLAVDLLAALPEVDAGRIGAVGHSLGAKEVLYLAAFDARVKAAVSSEGGVGVRFSNWHDDWYLGAEAARADFPRDHHELLALAAPRPFLLIGGESADGDRGWPYIAAALPIWRLFGEPAPLAFFNHRQGHAVPPEAEARIYEWLETYL
jgi:hypothetical protein